MDKVLEIDGIIGWDVDAKTVRAALDGMEGADVTIMINSAGGSVVEGIAIFNYLKNYKGKKTVKISGIAASMASYIAMAGDVVAVEENSIFMIHNASLAASGDYNDLKKAADISMQMSKILSNEYAKKTGIPVAKIRSMMDAETFFYGREILDSGFADVLSESGENGALNESRDSLVSDAAISVAMASDLIKKISTPADLGDLAACIDKIYPNNTRQNSSKPDIIDSMEKSMTLEQFKAEFPEIFDKIRETAIQDERKRVSGVLVWKGLSAEGDAILTEAIASGKTSEEIAQQMFIISQKKSNLDEDNAELVATAKTETVSGATGGIGLDDEDLKACKIFNIKMDDYKAMKESGENGKFNI